MLGRPGELLAAIPGLVISPHGGAGKANQYYLRGFFLDQGTDRFDIFNILDADVPDVSRCYNSGLRYDEKESRHPK